MQKDFLQSEEWRKFQESVGRKTWNVSGDGFFANIIEHSLPIVGKYFYIPRGPILNPPAGGKKYLDELINLAKKNNAGWIRFDAGSQEILDAIRNTVGVDLVPAPHNVQPKEIFVMDISKSREHLLAEMKPKTRYNIKLAEKKDVCARAVLRDNDFKLYVDEFVRLTSVMAKRNGISAHPENYYRKMLETISGDILKLYVAEYQGKIIAANLVVFYENTCIYLHGASDDEYRNVMAPYLLQWQQICDAKKAGCSSYDFGGVSVNSWAGITKFKLGFSIKTAPTKFLGSYDIVISSVKYNLYKIIQKIKSFL